MKNYKKLLKPFQAFKFAGDISLGDLGEGALYHNTGVDFIDQVFDHFDVSYYSSQKSRRNIPAQGRAVLVANHPLGSLDALGVLRFVSEIRQDVKLVTLELLADLPQLDGLVIRFETATWTGKRASFRRVIAALEQEQLLIFFPAIKLSGIKPVSRKLEKWIHRFLELAAHTQSPIVPAHIKKQSAKLPQAKTIAGVSRIQWRRDLHINVGEPIPCAALADVDGSMRGQCERLRRHVRRIAKGQPGTLVTQKAIIHPQHPLRLREELKDALLLGGTSDGQQIYLFDYRPDSAVMREIGRLREFTFRNVGEGTGHARDIDKYDHYYRHLVLWNERELEIVGAYRIGEAGNILRNYGVSGLYCDELFVLGDEFQQLLPQAIELGRSFVQPKYWGKRSLDYLWYGIGAYIRQHPGIRYLYGPVSISNSYPEPAKQALVGFYKHYFSHPASFANAADMALARKPYNDLQNADLRFMLIGDDYAEDFSRLKTWLTCFDVKVPTLYKQYTEISDTGGVSFLAFNVDPAFSNCVDGLVLADITRIKPKKLERYIGGNYEQQVVSG